MSVVVVRLWWARATPEEERRLRELLRPGSWSGDGCLTRRLCRDRDALVGTEVWADEAVAGRGLTALTARLRTAGLPVPAACTERVPGDGWTAN
jgi:hypothetical protein